MTKERLLIELLMDNELETCMRGFYRINVSAK